MSEQYGIVHAAGCPAPGERSGALIAALALPTWLERVADGAGGVVARCSHCGRTAGDLAPAERVATTGGPSAELVDRYALKALELREPDGSWPTQEALAAALNVGDRAIRKVGWNRILDRAAELGGSAGTSG